MGEPLSLSLSLSSFFSVQHAGDALSRYRSFNVRINETTSGAEDGSVNGTKRERYILRSIVETVFVRYVRVYVYMR